MDNASTPDKPPRVSPPVTDDIPVALRETVEVKPKPRLKRLVLLSGLGVLALIALGAGGWAALRIQQSQNSATSPESPAPSQSSPTTAPSANSDVLLGHFAYKEAPQSELEPIVDDGSIKLRKAAAKAYRAMVAAAAQDGINLVAISGFRSISDQQHLYFDVKAERAQDAEERAKVSAPPGYSEHHTGYAADIGDGSAPATNLNTSFDKTPAYRWLQANAARYSFEISFPKNNRQGVSYEPWHWRYVGDIDSLKTFYKARSPKQ